LRLDPAAKAQIMEALVHVVRKGLEMHVGACVAKLLQFSSPTLAVIALLCIWKWQHQQRVLLAAQLLQATQPSVYTLVLLKLAVLNGGASHHAHTAFRLEAAATV
jgi:hypothetical protein